MRTMTGQTTMYGGDGELSELRQAIEKGRKQKIAAEVLSEFLNNRREDIIRDFETGAITGGNALDAISELRVMKRFKDMAKNMIQLGEIAEERMNEIGG